MGGIARHLIVKPGNALQLADVDPGKVWGASKEEAAKQVKRNIEQLAGLGYRLYAENRRSLLVVLQGMDASGKDGTIRHVMTGLNPQSCSVTSFRMCSASAARRGRRGLSSPPTTNGFATTPFRRSSWTR